MAQVHVEMESGVLELKQLFLNNLQLLGFDVPAMEAANHIPFNKTMFDLPNRRGAEIVLHFLFQHLNPTMCREAFRDCWPILDKKREQLFRKTCASWLTNITQEEPDSHLPRINASLFMSPGGDKFYQLLFHFSSYVVQKTLDTELGAKASDRLKYPSLTSQNLHLGDVMVKDLSCSTIRHRKKYFEIMQQILTANKVWKDTAHDSVREYRKLTKELREKDYKIREEEQRAAEACLVRGSPAKRRGQTDQFEPDFDPRTIKRAQRLQQVRDMWKQMENFDRTEAAEREVIESIVERTVNKHCVDAADISIKVPDLLLRECQEEIRRRNVDNTYQGGKLNLVSLLQLWNLCLHLYREKIQHVGIPRFENVEMLTSQVHTQQTYLQNAQTLRQQMTDRIPEMKSSVEELGRKLDSAFFIGSTPETIRTTSIGLDLVEPSPEPSFSPKPGDTPAEGLHVPRSPVDVTTPDAAAKITDDVIAAVRLGPKQLFTDKHDPILARVQLVTGELKNKNETSIPKPASQKSSSKASSRQSSHPASRTTSQLSSKPTSRQSSKPSSGRSTASTIGSRKSGKATSVHADSPRGQITVKLDTSLPRVSSPRTLMDSYQSDISNNTQSSFHEDLGVSPRSERSQGSSTLSGGSKQGWKTPTDLLVEEIMGEAEVLSPFTGLEAFVTRENVIRTPEFQAGEEENKENVTPTNEDILDVQGPELQESGDESDVSQKSQESPIVIDRSVHHSPPPSHKSPSSIDRSLLSPEMEPGIDQEEIPDLDGSPLLTHTAIIIDRSFNAKDQEKHSEEENSQESFLNQSAESHTSAGNQSRGSTGSHSSTDSAGKRSGSSPGSQHSTSKADSRLFHKGSPSLSRSAQFTRFTEEEIQSMKARIPYSSSFSEEVRSPLREEIRKMYKEAIADTTPKRLKVGAHPDLASLKRDSSIQRQQNGSPQQSENGTFSPQVELEGLVFGEDIVRRQSDYFSNSGYLSKMNTQKKQNRNKGDNGEPADDPISPTPDSPGVTSPGIDFILKGVKSLEKRLLGEGTPLDTPKMSDDELELPVLDPNSMQSNEARKLVPVDWDLDNAENLDDIEMPDMEFEADSDLETPRKKNSYLAKDGDLELQMPSPRDCEIQTDSLDAFFLTKTPELPKRSYHVQSDKDSSLNIPGTSLDSETSPRPLKFPQVSTLQDEPSLITFTP